MTTRTGAAALLLSSLGAAGAAWSGELRFRHAIDRDFTEEGEALSRAQLEKTAAGSTHTSPWNSSDFPFNEVLVSWNVSLPADGGFTVELRFSRQARGEVPSGWYHLGRFGAFSPVEKILSEDAGGKVNIDCFSAKGFYHAFQYRLRLHNGAAEETRLQRFTVVVSNSPGSAELFAKLGKKPATLPGTQAIRLEVPFRSQKVEDPAIRGRICSPTSVAMILAYRGIDRPTRVVAARAYDRDQGIYGNWPANIQAAFSLGARGRIARFRSWEAARETIAAGQPLVISIRDKMGALKGAPYPKTDGHLLVLTGFDTAGNVCVNDPAANDATQGIAVYDREQMEEVWLNQGGVAYLIGEP